MSQGGPHIRRPDKGPHGHAEGVGKTKPPAVLLVEDDSSIVGSLEEALREEGFEVASAQNGREALDLLRTGARPSAILLDLMMPVMDGWDFRHEQLRDPAIKDIPVIVITATGFSAETIRKQFGPVDLLPKPVPYQDLLALLGRAAGAPTGC